jgi:glucose-1-phosphatase
MTSIKISNLKGTNIDTIIFDLGGVLLNLDTQRTVNAFKELGVKNIEQEMAGILNRDPRMNTPGLFNQYETGKISSSGFRDRLRECAGMDLDDDDINRAWTSMLLDIPRENLLLLERLSGSFRVFMLSNTNEIHVKNLRARNNGFSDLEKVFEKAYLSFEIGMRKPDVEIFSHVIKDARLVAGNSLFIDDSVLNIEGAEKAGLQTFQHKTNSALTDVFDFN